GIRPTQDDGKLLHPLVGASGFEPERIRRNKRRFWFAVILRGHLPLSRLPGISRTVTNSRAPQGTVTVPPAASYSPPVSRSNRSVRRAAAIPKSGRLILAAAVLLPGFHKRTTSPRPSSASFR